VISRTSYDRNTFKQATATVKFVSRLACEHPNIRRHIIPAVYKTPLNSWRIKVLYITLKNWVLQNITRLFLFSHNHCLLW